MKILLFALGLLAAQAIQVIDLTRYYAEVYSSPVTLTVGEKMQIMLQENPSTGFEWNTIDQDLDKTGAKDMVRLTNKGFA